MTITSSILRKAFVLTLATLGLASAAEKATPPGDFYDEVSRLNKVFSEVNRKYVEDVNPTELTDAALNGIRNILDPHTAVFTPKDYEGLKVSMEGKFGGVGITISLRPFPGLPLSDWASGPATVSAKSTARTPRA